MKKPNILFFLAHGLSLWLLTHAAAVLLLERSASAGTMEFSAGFSYSASNYVDVGSSWTRRLSVGLGYYFFGESEIEFEVQDVVDRTQIPGIEDTTFHDQVYSLEWIQGLAPRDSFVRPYFKAGFGQLHRTASGSYFGTTVPTDTYDQLTGIFGVGIRFHVYHAFSLRFEGSTYLINGALSTAPQNFSVNSGLSVYF